MTKEDILTIAKRYYVDQSDILTSFLCELLEISEEDLYKQLCFVKPKEYKISFTYTQIGEETISAETVEEAKEKWEARGYDANIFLIEDEEGNQYFYD